MLSDVEKNSGVEKADHRYKIRFEMFCNFRKIIKLFSIFETDLEKKKTFFLTFQNFEVSQIWGFQETFFFAVWSRPSRVNHSSPLHAGVLPFS